MLDDGALQPLLETREPGLDAVPSRGDEVDEDPEVVDPRVPFGEELLLEALEASQRLVHAAANLGEAPAHGDDLPGDPVAHRDRDLLRERLLEIVGDTREAHDLRARALERRVETGARHALAGAAGDPLSCPFQCFGVHGAQGYARRRMRSSELDYDLPAELVAQRPVEPRDASRLLVHDRVTGVTRHRSFADLPGELDGHLVVVNDTRVVPARLALRRASGGAVEVLLLEHLGQDRWEALARPSRRLRAGELLRAGGDDDPVRADNACVTSTQGLSGGAGGGSVELLDALGGGRWRVRLEGEPHGGVPLPPYIHETPDDPERYQTVYGAHSGSAAAPTAGLHFTPELLARLDHERVTLHVGLDTFRPLTTDTVEEHALHGERYSVTPAAWERIASARKVLAVGTTTTRVVETLACGGPLEGRSHLFVTPGFAFRRVDTLLTNFHLPRTTLLALVMAFVGIETTRELYALAIRERYRFYSFGDAMLIL